MQQLRHSKRFGFSLATFGSRFCLQVHYTILRNCSKQQCEEIIQETNNGSEDYPDQEEKPFQGSSQQELDKDNSIQDQEPSIVDKIYQLLETPPNQSSKIPRKKLQQLLQDAQNSAKLEELSVEEVGMLARTCTSFWLVTDRSILTTMLRRLEFAYRTRKIVPKETIDQLIALFEISGGVGKKKLIQRCLGCRDWISDEDKKYSQRFLAEPATVNGQALTVLLDRIKSSEHRGDFDSKQVMRLFDVLGAQTNYKQIEPYYGVVEQLVQQNDFSVGDCLKMISIVLKICYQDQPILNTLTEKLQSSIQKQNDKMDTTKCLQCLKNFVRDKVYEQKTFEIICDQLRGSLGKVELHKGIQLFNHLTESGHVDDNLYKDFQDLFKSKLDLSVLSQAKQLITPLYRITNFGLDPQDFDASYFIRQILQHHVSSLDSQQLQLLAYGLTKINDWDPDQWDIIQKQIPGINFHNLAHNEVMCWHQVHMIANMRNVQLNFSEEQLKLISQNLKKNLQRGQSSKFQKYVLDTLRRLKYRSMLDIYTEDGLMEIDLALRLGEHKLAVEVDGPSHFLMNKPDKMTRATELRNELLEHRGWNVVCIPYSGYDLALAEYRENEYVSGLIQQKLRQLNAPQQKSDDQPQQQQVQQV
eukprot:TRINITY_DN39024_c0_g1_i5.p1 TRINITY_DN39024_c0_g1~~TRINITY_DN39024_c0_g1_i5.p1  ORF type:complete len:641 (+),score=47.59 TRINITY_DN39024_c0_g1_i5:72-1994(+)